MTLMLGSRITPDPGGVRRIETLREDRRTLMVYGARGTELAGQGFQRFLERFRICSQNLFRPQKSGTKAEEEDGVFG